MQQIRTTNKVLHRSASNYILNDLQSTGVNAKKMLTSTELQITGSDCHDKTDV